MHALVSSEALGAVRAAHRGGVLGRSVRGAGDDHRHDRTGPLSGRWPSWWASGRPARYVIVLPRLVITSAGRMLARSTVTTWTLRADLVRVAVPPRWARLERGGRHRAAWRDDPQLGPFLGVVMQRGSAVRDVEVGHGCNLWRTRGPVVGRRSADCGDATVTRCWSKPCSLKNPDGHSRRRRRRHAPDRPGPPPQAPDEQQLPAPRSDGERGGAGAAARLDARGPDSGAHPAADGRADRASSAGAGAVDHAGRPAAPSCCSASPRASPATPRGRHGGARGDCRRPGPAETRRLDGPRHGAAHSATARREASSRVQQAVQPLQQQTLQMQAEGAIQHTLAGGADVRRGPGDCRTGARAASRRTRR